MYCSNNSNFATHPLKKKRSIDRERGERGEIKRQIERERERDRESDREKD